MRCAGGAGCGGADTAAAEGAEGADATAEATATEGTAVVAGGATCLGCGRRVKVRGVLWRRCCLVKTERAA